LRFAPVIHAAAAAVLSLLVLGPATALAASSGENTPLNLPSDGGAKHTTGVSGGGGSLVRTFVGLAIVLAVIYGIASVLKQVKSSKEERRRGSGLDSTAVVPLGPNRALHLVRAGKELVLVGVAEQGVVPIRTYTEEEAIALGLIGEDAEPEQHGGTPSGPSTGGRDSLLALQGKVRETLEGLRARTVRG